MREGEQRHRTRNEGKMERKKKNRIKIVQRGASWTAERTGDGGEVPSQQNAHRKSSGTLLMLCRLFPRQTQKVSASSGRRFGDTSSGQHRVGGAGLRSISRTGFHCARTKPRFRAMSRLWRESEEESNKGSPLYSKLFFLFFFVFPTPSKVASAFRWCFRGDHVLLRAPR